MISKIAATPDTIPAGAAASVVTSASKALAASAGAAGTPMSDAERQVRIDLAAAYRLVAYYGMDDSIYTHISARVPGEPGAFLINHHPQRRALGAP